MRNFLFVVNILGNVISWENSHAILVCSHMKFANICINLHKF